MTRTIPKTSHPYRESDLATFCVVCAKPALVRCPRCRRPFCTDHAALGACCADCELSLAESTRKWTLGTMIGYLCTAGSATCWMLWAHPILGVATGAFSVLGGILVAAIGHRLARRGLDRSWPLVENAELKISPEAGEARAPRRLGWLMRSSAKQDMYDAAHDAGFNRVQGCA